MSKIKPITGGWRVLLGSALAGVVFLIVKPAIQKEHQLMWAVAFGGLGATSAWALELYKPAVRISKEDECSVAASNQIPASFYPASLETITVNPVELKLSSDLTDAVKTLSSLVGQNLPATYQVTQNLPAAQERSFVQERSLPSSETPVTNYSNGSKPAEYTQLIEVTSEVTNPKTNLIIEEDYLCPADDEDEVAKVDTKPQKEEDVWS